MQTAIEFASAGSAGAIETPGDKSGDASRLRILPFADSPALDKYFALLRVEAALVVLPLVPAGALGSHITRLQPDVVVIVSNNIAAAPWRNDSSLRQALSTTPTILLAPGVNGAAWRLAAEFGMASVLPQNLGHRQLIAAIQAAAAGLAVTLPSPADKAAEPDNARERHLREMPLVEHLTPREKAVLDRMAHGCGNKEIAAQLDISEHTAKFHVSSILAKLGAASRTEAVTIGILGGLVAI